VLTNKSPCSPYRGAGGPEATFARERLLDIAAAELGMDPADLRMRNLIPPELLPYTLGSCRSHRPSFTTRGTFRPGSARR
jgi:aerobic carbon-monoxide dehydrogenase large subunit